MEEIKVSVLCLAYNHEKYIRNALDGFIMQKTSFKFEVLIHDDASTDNTAAIIREYEEKYPDIIKPIYQTENQHSKRVPISRQLLLPIAQGKYIAWCEGDDFWTDPYKLQKQYDFLESHPEYIECVHCAVYSDVKKGTKKVLPKIKKDTDYSIDEVIKGGGGLFATNSLMILKSANINMPECFSARGFGDYQLFMYGAIHGKLHCLSDVMSQYNYGLPGSWTDRNEANKDKLIVHFKALIDMLKRVDEYYGYKYTKPITKVVRKHEYIILRHQKEIKGYLKFKYLPFMLAGLKRHTVELFKKLFK